MKAIIVNVTSWCDVGSIGAEHYYAKLHVVETDKKITELAKNPYDYSKEYDEEEFEMQRSIDQKEADYLNNKDSWNGWKEGMKTGRFNTIAEVIIETQRYIDDNKFEGSAIIVRNWEKVEGVGRIIYDPRTLAEEKEYRDTAPNRKTGRKIKILGCMAHGQAFQNLPIGEVVNELDMSKEGEEMPNRGVWIWGNGEPIKLVNDCGFKEYEVVAENTPEGILDAIYQTLDLKADCLTELEEKGILHAIEDEEYSGRDIGNLICEHVGIEKRGNRSTIEGIVTKARNKN